MSDWCWPCQSLEQSWVWELLPHINGRLLDKSWVRAKQWKPSEVCNEFINLTEPGILLHSLEHHLPDLYLLTHYWLYTKRGQNQDCFWLRLCFAISYIGRVKKCWRTTTAALARCNLISQVTEVKQRQHGGVQDLFHTAVMNSSQALNSEFLVVSSLQCT